MVLSEVEGLKSLVSEVSAKNVEVFFFYSHISVTLLKLPGHSRVLEGPGEIRDS